MRLEHPGWAPSIACPLFKSRATTMISWTRHCRMGHTWKIPAPKSALSQRPSGHRRPRPQRSSRGWEGCGSRCGLEALVFGTVCTGGPEAAGAGPPARNHDGVPGEGLADGPGSQHASLCFSDPLLTATQQVAPPAHPGDPAAQVKTWVTRWLGDPEGRACARGLEPDEKTPPRAPGERTATKPGTS